MVFTVHVASDLFKAKENISLEFPTRPSMKDLVATCEAAYDIETRSRRGSHPDFPFRVDQFQYHDATTDAWVELFSDAQLAHNGQIFAFQAENDLHSDVEGLVPAPKSIAAWSPGPTPVERCAVPPLDAAARRQAAFTAICARQGNGSKAVTYWGLRSTLDLCQIRLATHAVGDMLTACDADRDGMLKPSEWRQFAEAYGGVVDALYFRLLDAEGGHTPVSAALANEIAQERQRLVEYAKRVKEERRTRQKKVVERMASGKTSHVTSFEVAAHEKWLSRLGEEDQRRRDVLARKKNAMRRDEAAGAAAEADAASTQPPTPPHPPADAASSAAGRVSHQVGSHQVGRRISPALGRCGVQPPSPAPATTAKQSSAPTPLASPPPPRLALGGLASPSHSSSFVCAPSYTSTPASSLFAAPVHTPVCYM